MHPPVDKRCQIYVSPPSSTSRDLRRCINPGTHWEKWGGCGCGDPSDVCEAEFYSWECEGPHLPMFQEAA